MNEETPDAARASRCARMPHRGRCAERIEFASCVMRPESTAPAAECSARPRIARDGRSAGASRQSWALSAARPAVGVTSQVGREETPGASVGWRWVLPAGAGPNGEHTPDARGCGGKKRGGEAELSRCQTFAGVQRKRYTRHVGHLRTHLIPKPGVRKGGASIIAGEGNRRRRRSSRRRAMRIFEGYQ